MLLRFLAGLSGFTNDRVRNIYLKTSITCSHQTKVGGCRASFRPVVHAQVTCKIKKPVEGYVSICYLFWHLFRLIFYLFENDQKRNRKEIKSIAKNNHRQTRVAYENARNRHACACSIFPGISGRLTRADGQMFVNGKQRQLEKH